MHKIQIMLQFLVALSVSAVLLVGCAKSGPLSPTPDLAPYEPTLTLGQTTPQPSLTPKLTTTSSATPIPDSTVQPEQNNTGHLDLRQRSLNNWEVVDGGAFGTLTYNLSGPNFVFEFYGERLEAETSYSLIYYAASDLRPENLNSDIPGALIAQGTSDSEGNIHLKDSVNLGIDLPYPDDANYEYIDCCAEYGADHGARIWLVPSECYNSINMTVREDKCQPDRFLFETDLIIYDDTNS